MKQVIILILFIVFLYDGTPILATGRVPIQLKEQTERLVELIRDAYAVNLENKYHLRSFQGRGIAVVFLAFEGFGRGNNWSHYMAVFSPVSEPEADKQQYYSLIDFVCIGGKGWRAADFEKVRIQYDQKLSEATIVIQTLENTKDDAPNFPSKESRAIFKIKPFRGEHIREIRLK